MDRHQGNKADYRVAEILHPSTKMQLLSDTRHDLEHQCGKRKCVMRPINPRSLVPIKLSAKRGEVFMAKLVEKLVVRIGLDVYNVYNG